MFTLLMSHTYKTISMLKNVPKTLLLFAFFAFLFHSCGTTSKIPSKSTTYRKSTANKKDKNTSEYLLRKQVINYAKRQEGTKYRYGGMSKSGFDCSGLSCFVMKKVNKVLPRNSTAQSKQGKKIPIKKAQAGDLVFFGKNGKVNHVAIVLENNGGELKVIHSTSSRGVIIEDVNRSPYWRPKLMFAKNILIDY